jgi:hypothetical protein
MSEGMCNLNLSHPWIKWCLVINYGARYCSEEM